MSENSMELSELLPKPLESDKKLKVLFHLYFCRDLDFFGWYLCSIYDLALLKEKSVKYTKKSFARQTKMNP